MGKKNNAPGLLADVPLDQISESPDNARTLFDDEHIGNIGESFREHGQAQPVLLKILGPERYQLVEGHCRVRAAKAIGWTHIRADIRELTDGAARRLSLIANIHRAPLNPLDEARAFDALLKHGDVADVAALAALVRRSERTLYKNLALLELIPEAQAALVAPHEEGQFWITPAHAELIRTGHTPEEQAKVLAQCWVVEPIDENDGAGYQPVRRQRSERELRAWVRSHLREDAPAPVSEPTPEQAAAAEQASTEAQADAMLDDESDETPGNGTNDDTEMDPEPTDSDDVDPEEEGVAPAEALPVTAGERAGKSAAENAAADQARKVAEWNRTVKRIHMAMESISPAGLEKYMVGTLYTATAGVMVKQLSLLGMEGSSADSWISRQMGNLTRLNQPQYNAYLLAFIAVAGASSTMADYSDALLAELQKSHPITAPAEAKTAKKVRKTGIAKARATVKKPKKALKKAPIRVTNQPKKGGKKAKK